MAEKEAQLLEDDRSGFEFLPTMSDKENIEKWRVSCADKTKKPKHDHEQSGKKIH